MYVYIYIYIYTHIHIYIYIYVMVCSECRNGIGRSRQGTPYWLACVDKMNKYEYNDTKGEGSGNVPEFNDTKGEGSENVSETPYLLFLS